MNLRFMLFVNLLRIRAFRQLGGQPEERGSPLRPADGAARWDPAAPVVRVGTNPGRGTAPGLGVGDPAEHVKLEAEIATYCRLLEDGEDFNLGDALDSSNSMQTIQKKTTGRRVDDKELSEINKVLSEPAEAGWNNDSWTSGRIGALMQGFSPALRLLCILGPNPRRYQLSYITRDMCRIVNVIPGPFCGCESVTYLGSTHSCENNSHSCTQPIGGILTLIDTFRATGWIMALRPGFRTQEVSPRCPRRALRPPGRDPGGEEAEPGGPGALRLAGLENSGRPKRATPAQVRIRPPPPPDSGAGGHSSRRFPSGRGSCLPAGSLRTGTPALLRAQPGRGLGGGTALEPLSQEKRGLRGWWQAGNLTVQAPGWGKGCECVPLPDPRRDAHSERRSEFSSSAEPSAPALDHTLEFSHPESLLASAHLVILEHAGHLMQGKLLLFFSGHGWVGWQHRTICRCLANRYKKEMLTSPWKKSHVGQLENKISWGGEARCPC
ncbi:uncharacterized protein LOC114674171 [Macaca mulatta]